MQAFDVERALSKALGIRVETFLCGPSEYKFRVGQRWQLCVDEDQLGQLWSDVDNPSVLRDSFDALKAECLAFISYKR
ncbi:hypothetical protein IFT67_12460 [Sphingomonas sp. CFBP 13728]|uniref:hypothetical protein n=1 Tax=Sphingomonas sp. CFBP 13728 TaxID=2775294 RepID=UPI00177ACD34|nr:hypothetical protein [Sphingomonas sp. CFBP 13728]MBD8619734.1 hypothetical protein [Sphingomonas sp. CFBP 13728]